MANFLFPKALKWTKYLPWLNQRCFSCEYDGRWSGAPLCKGRKIPKAEKLCQPKEGSCNAIMADCPIKKFPVCFEAHVKPAAHLSCCSDNRLTEMPCNKPETKLEKQEEKKPFISMWEVNGMEYQCPDAVARLDELHYKPTDKTKRVYTQTWESCAPVVRKRKVCCINEMCMLPPINKRPKTECPQTAKEQDLEQLLEDYKLLKKCLQQKITSNVKKTGKNKCQKITMPYCRKVAKNLKCHKSRKTYCLKECCPHPSFSECDRAELKKDPRDECRCSHFISQCDADQFLGRKQFFKLPPALPAWPPKERPK